MWTRTLCPLLVMLLAGCGDSGAVDASDSGGGTDAGVDAPLLPVDVAPASVETLSCTACASDCDEERLVYASRNHLPNEIIYADSPPAGGDHDRCWASWGVYDEPLPARNWVHNLEHGGIVVLYDCPDGCEAERAELAAWVESLGNGAILTPAQDLPRRFAVIAWEHRLLTDCLDLDAFADFHARRADQAPESTTAMPPGSCMP